MISTEQLAANFKERFGTQPLVCSAPGRVNLIGEHTDYNDGFVLPFAIDKRTYVAGSVRHDNIISVYTQTLDKAVEFSIGDPPVGEANKWGLYVAGVASIMQRSGTQIKGANLLVHSDIPFGAGLSSSAAMEVAVGIMLDALSGTKTKKRDIALNGQKVEHEFLGVRSGIMDQFASALSEVHHALLLDCRSLEIENVPLNIEGMFLVVADTRVKHSLAGSEYNNRRQQCEEGVEILKRHYPDIKALRDATETQLNECAGDFPADVLKRCRHVVTENARTLRAAEAVRRGHTKLLGELMYESHESLRTDYEVSCGELDFLVDHARNIEGVIGSRMTGGGFGGCTITVLRAETYEEFRSSIERSYEAAFQKAPDVFRVRPSEGARLIN
jgi:galactokinase